jgi:EF hand
MSIFRNKPTMNQAMIAALTALLWPATAALAQDRPAPDRKARAEQIREQFDQRFAAADVNGDGKLTREESKAKMPRVAEHFDEIDTAKKGYVTKEDIRASMQKRRAERHGKSETPAN